MRSPVSGGAKVHSFDVIPGYNFSHDLDRVFFPEGRIFSDAVNSAVVRAKHAGRDKENATAVMQAADGTYFVTHLASTHTRAPVSWVTRDASAPTREKLLIDAKPLAGELRALVGPNDWINLTSEDVRPDFSQQVPSPKRVVPIQEHSLLQPGLSGYGVVDS